MRKNACSLVCQLATTGTFYVTHRETLPRKPKYGATPYVRNRACVCVLCVYDVTLHIHIYIYIHPTKIV